MFKKIVRQARPLRADSGPGKKKNWTPKQGRTGNAKRKRQKQKASYAGRWPQVPKRSDATEKGKTYATYWGPLPDGRAPGISTCLPFPSRWHRHRCLQYYCRLRQSKQRGQKICSIIRSESDYSSINRTLPFKTGTEVTQWSRYCATNRKVAGSIPDGVIGIFH
jgi:hypothetical protein